MKAVILAGGRGTRLSEETDKIPKPMVEIAGRPILWHIMKYFSHFGINEFIICVGYRGYVIKEYFSNYFLHNSDVTFDLSTNTISVHEKYAEPWKVTVVDTGEDSQTGGRLGRVRRFLDSGERFFFTYGDGLSDVDLHAVLKTSLDSDCIATVTAVSPPARFGNMGMATDGSCLVRSFAEKPKTEAGLINGGFFVLKDEVFDHIKGDETVWETEILPVLARSEQLAAHVHSGFWQPMDTLREREYLDKLWEDGVAPWKMWS